MALLLVALLGVVLAAYGVMSVRAWRRFERTAVRVHGVMTFPRIDQRRDASEYTKYYIRYFYDVDDVRHEGESWRPVFRAADCKAGQPVVVLFPAGRPAKGQLLRDGTVAGSVVCVLLGSILVLLCAVAWLAEAGYLRCLVASWC
jgi:hypothetical protein